MGIGRGSTLGLGGRGLFERARFDGFSFALPPVAGRADLRPFISGRTCALWSKISAAGKGAGVVSRCGGGGKKISRNREFARGICRAYCVSRIASGGMDRVRYWALGVI